MDATRSRVVVAVDADLVGRLARSVRRAGVGVRELPPGPGLVDRVVSCGATMALLPWTAVATEEGRSALAAIAAHSGAPAVVVLGDGESAEARAEVVAAGAHSVLEGGAPPRRIAEAIESVASTRAGGTDGQPDVGGANTKPRLADFLSRSPQMREFLDVVERVGSTDPLRLITGETGVGKEHLARAIHSEGPRARGPFVGINCGALPENLLESELFGHEKGAFTGAHTRRAGHFEQAHGGTIFLDEVGELPSHLQVKLLTVLQRHEVQRLGAKSPVVVDVRVMAATNRDLAAEVREGRFREDLYYRVNVVPLAIPPLRHRREDLPDLIGNFIRFFRKRLDRDVEGIDPDALDALVAHDWPGNLRELINVVERAMLLCRGDRITRTDLPSDLGGAPTAPNSSSEGTLSLPEGWHARPLTDVKRQVGELFERRYLIRILKETGGQVGEAAARAGIAPRSLYEKMRHHGLRKEDYR